MLKILSVELSSKSPAIASKDGINGQISVTSDGREFVVVKLQEVDNNGTQLDPFAQPKIDTRLYSQVINKTTGEKSWTGVKPCDLVNYVGKVIPGQFVTAEVEEYTWTDSKGVERTSNTRTRALFSNENPERAFGYLGHPMVKSIPVPTSVEAGIM